MFYDHRKNGPIMQKADKRSDQGHDEPQDRTIHCTKRNDFFNVVPVYCLTVAINRSGQSQ